MKSKGFTLLELLAVIVILSVIALITVPKIVDLIDSSKTKVYNEQISFIESAAEKWSVSNTNLISQDSAYYVSLNTLINSGYVDQDKLIDPRTGEDMAGCVKISFDFSYNKYIYKYGEKCDSSFGGTFVSAKTGETHKGIIYLNPKNLSATCNATLASQNVNEYGALTGINTGCMKFYIFDASGDNYTMILDHNTSGNVARELYNYADAIIEVESRLSEDTSGWSGNPRLITQNDVRTITNNTSNDWYFFGANGQVGYSSQSSEQKARQNSYHWLFDNLNESTNNGGEVDDNYQYVSSETNIDYVKGYWTSSKYSDSSTATWIVFWNGTLGGSDALDPYQYGVRPVITLPKSTVTE